MVLPLYCKTSVTEFTSCTWSSFAVAANSDGRGEVFGVGIDGSIWQTSMTDKYDPESWTQPRQSGKKNQKVAILFYFYVILLATLFYVVCTSIGVLGYECMCANDGINGNCVYPNMAYWSNNGIAAFTKYQPSIFVDPKDGRLSVVFNGSNGNLFLAKQHV